MYLPVRMIAYLLLSASFFNASLSANHGGGPSTSSGATSSPRKRRRSWDTQVPTDEDLPTVLFERQATSDDSPPPKRTCLRELQLEDDSNYGIETVAGLHATAIAFTPNSQHVAIGCQDGKMYLYDVESQNLHLVLDANNDEYGAIKTIKFITMPSGLYVVTLHDSSHENNVFIWKMPIDTDSLCQRIYTFESDHVKHCSAIDISVLDEYNEDNPQYLISLGAGHIVSYTIISYNQERVHVDNLSWGELEQTGDVPCLCSAILSTPTTIFCGTTTGHVYKMSWRDGFCQRVAGPCVAVCSLAVTESSTSIDGDVTTVYVSYQDGTMRTWNTAKSGMSRVDLMYVNEQAKSAKHIQIGCSLSSSGPSVFISMNAATHSFRVYLCRMIAHGSMSCSDEMAVSRYKIKMFLEAPDRGHVAWLDSLGRANIKLIPSE